MSANGAKPDLIFVTLIHQALRIDGAWLVATSAGLAPDDASRLSALHRFFDEYRNQLVAHHTHEDTLFFPALKANVAEGSTNVDELVAQHHQLDAALESVGACFAALAATDADFAGKRSNLTDALATMVEQLTAHLDLEERTALPLIVSHIPLSEYKKLEATARKAAPRDQSGFLIAWIVEHASSEQRTALFRAAPPLRIVSRLNRRRYRRCAEVLLPAG